MLPSLLVFLPLVESLMPFKICMGLVNFTEVPLTEIVDCFQLVTGSSSATGQTVVRRFLTQITSRSIIEGIRMRNHTSANAVSQLIDRRVDSSTTWRRCTTKSQPDGQGGKGKM